MLLFPVHVCIRGASVGREGVIQHWNHDTWQNKSRCLADATPFTGRFMSGDAGAMLESGRQRHRRL
jgi:hypothetical protein